MNFHNYREAGEAVIGTDKANFNIFIYKCPTI